MDTNAQPTDKTENAEPAEPVGTQPSLTSAIEFIKPLLEKYPEEDREAIALLSVSILLQPVDDGLLQTVIGCVAYLRDFKEPESYVAQVREVLEALDGSN